MRGKGKEYKSVNPILKFIMVLANAVSVVWMTCWMPSLIWIISRNLVLSIILGLVLYNIYLVAEFRLNEKFKGKEKQMSIMRYVEILLNILAIGTCAYMFTILLEGQLILIGTITIISFGLLAIYEVNIDIAEEMYNNTIKFGKR